MKLINALRLTCLLVAGLSISAQAANVGEPLPHLKIVKAGEILIQDDEVNYGPWDSQRAVEKVHVLQYIPGTLSASKMFEPFTDYLLEHYGRQGYHVTTVIDLDAALWGTGSFVASEIEKNKRKYPLSTLVLDKSGSGVDVWSLGNTGSGLFILDRAGVVQFSIGHKMSVTEQQNAAEVFASLIKD